MRPEVALSPDTAVALIVLSGVILTAVLGLIGTILTVWLSGRKDRQQQRQLEADRHEENRDALATLTADMAAVKADLPPDGLAAWGRTISANTKALAAQAKATTQLSDSVTALSERMGHVEATVAVLQNAGTA